MLHFRNPAKPRHEPERPIAEIGQVAEAERFRAVATDTKRELASACSIKARHSEAAEEVAIPLAILISGYSRIISDSKPAIRNYTREWNTSDAVHI
ncbi:hypothetical protein HPB50_014124 [Hyalomma asiaticum]|uniref:Uncharacterized protein n=1 Tax=Hyalomma asiaticum TaxID=266040 RepID=A0ACB7T7H6_HYAAI|nr:hypothetical protein HPB50_014124 [Hyalomma asiaticum]